MPDQFDDCLKRFRGELAQGGVQKIKEDLAAGRYAGAKARAAAFALQEYEDAQNGDFVMSVLDDPSCWERICGGLKSFWRDHAAAIINTVISGVVLALVLAWLGFK